LLIFIKMIENFTEKELRMRTLECLNTAVQSSLHYDALGTQFDISIVNTNLEKYEKIYRPIMIKKGIDALIYDKKVKTIKNKLNKDHSPKRMEWR